MCSLCGVLGGRAHWSEHAGGGDGFERGAQLTRQRERQWRTRLANRVLTHYGLTLADWAATSYVLRGATGRTALVDNLSELWAAAEGLAKRPCDPLDEALLAALDETRALP